MDKTTFHITDMDCPSEEQMIRMRLADIDGLEKLAFDIGERRLDAYHHGSSEEISEALAGLNLGARRVAHQERSGSRATNTMPKPP